VNDLKIEHPGLYRPAFAKDNCGFGLIAHMDGVASHWLVETAIGALARMTHRGAIAADGKTGDGCGLLLKKPDSFLRAVAAERGWQLGEHYAVGMVFLNPQPELAQQARDALEQALQAQRLEVIGWRPVPVDSSACGDEALAALPQIEQIFVSLPLGMMPHDMERHLYMARRRVEKAIDSAVDPIFYLPSLSAEVLSYKGLVMPDYLSVFYPDLKDERLTSAICVFHQRFATNTLPDWRLAQPFRMLAHNGEINTIQGNRNWSLARGHKFETPLLDMATVRPIVSMTGSDSNSLDNMLEGLVAGGMDLFRAMRLLIPPAWQNIDSMDADLRAFYEYNSMHMEPWDGPAGIVLTDGRYAACSLDRNGLRPARWVITQSPVRGEGYPDEQGTYHNCVITLASEIGVFDYAPESVVAKGRLKPGQMLAADTITGELLLPSDVDHHLKSRHPYKAWLSDHLETLRDPTDGGVDATPMFDSVTLNRYQKLFQISFEERDQVLRPLAEAGQEAVGSMGDDTPMAVLSSRVRSLYDYFRQQFAQVTNPPIDPLREQIVMALETCLGPEQNLFEELPEFASRMVVDSPVLSRGKFEALLGLDDRSYANESISLHYRDISLREAIVAICDQAVAAIRDRQRVVLVLTDRNLSAEMLTVPAPLATGAVHHRLIAEGLRCDANLIIDTGSVRDPHHFAVLIGYGATAVHPYLAYEVLHDMVRSGEIKSGEPAQLMAKYRKGINKGLYKITSKMGISTITSYRGAQLFESVGLADEVVDLCFTGTTNRLQGTDFSDIESDLRTLQQQAWNRRRAIEPGGLLKYTFNGEYHSYNPDVIGTLHQAVRSGDSADYQRYADLVNQRPVATLRDLLQLRDDVTPIPLDEVEPVEAIYRRFDSAAMSLGALSPEAHETLAQAMNRLGGRSNSGEGGEDPARFGTDKMSKIKQIASGRFGVTPHYLVNAEVLQIKVAQGAKPGEGGQLPGDKVNGLIARLRYAMPGVALISPPPHHDIYSIEDLAQLIFDLKQVNPQALVSVKLVAEAGVGTIAAGVAKAYADLITISGYDGGTGASPLTSVKYAGAPWELGLSEAHQILRANNLRDKVRVQTDGGLKTGLDVIKAAILGAESFGFGTGPMVAMGCKYLRICHLNNCATGVATQDEVLRRDHYVGEAEMVMNYFRFIAEEVRQWLAKLGCRSVTDLIGRTDLLQRLPGATERQRKLDLSPIVANGAAAADAPRYCTAPRNAPFDRGELAEQMVRDALPAIEAASGGEFHYTVRNVNRSIGARLSGEIARRHGNLGMASSPITLRLTGTAGQSFGVWNAGGLHLYLEGDANDYVGKGMAGGQLAIYPPTGSRFNSHETAIIGNTCLYGATGGYLYAAGVAGERFGVRNSGAVAVVEGVGDHGCEYMTGGCITVLGETGVNFGAGMTGGFAYVLDSDRQFVNRYNHELIDIHGLGDARLDDHRDHLRGLIEAFVAATGSRWGEQLLATFADRVEQFWLVKPKATEITTLLDTLQRAA